LKNFDLANQVYDFSTGGAIDSKIINFEQARKIKAWISSGQVKLELLYRASRDTFKSSSFHEKCDKEKCTITIAQSKCDDQILEKIFGGYIDDQDWSGGGNYKNSYNGFLFSVNQDEIYTSKNSNTIYCSNGYGPTFGGGHNIYLCDNCDSTNSSYCNFSDSYYDVKGRTWEHITGQYNFKCREVEVFKVTYKGKLAFLNK